MNRYNLTEDEANYLKNLTKQISEHSEDSELLTKLGAFLFACAYHTEEPISYLEKAINLNPYYIDAYFWLAKCLFHYQLNYTEAEKVLNTALSIDTERADCLSLLSSVIFSLSGYIPKCKHLTQKAVQCSPDWIIPRQQLITYLIIEGKYSDAEQEIDKLLKVLQDNLKNNIKPVDAVEGYYERCVTGRDAALNEKHFSDALARLDEVKLLKTLNPLNTNIIV